MRIIKYIVAHCKGVNIFFFNEATISDKYLPTIANGPLLLWRANPPPLPSTQPEFVKIHKLFVNYKRVRDH